MMEYRRHVGRAKGGAGGDRESASKLGGTGGLIALDREGNFAMPFNTSGMYRGTVDADGKIMVEIYR